MYLLIYSLYLEIDGMYLVAAGAFRETPYKAR